MTSSRRRVLAAGLPAAGLLLAAAWWQPWHTPPAAEPGLRADDTTPIPVRPDSEEPYEPYKYQLTTDQTVRVFEDRVRDDPNHLTLTQLGGLYVRQARESGDHAPYEKADAAFRRALAALPGHAPARIGLALTTCARHRFAEGLKLAEAVYRDDPEELDALTVIADAHLELGNYADAEARVRELERKAPRPTPPGVLARQARLAELRGDPDGAVRLLRLAADAARASQDTPPARAWYPMRLGEVTFSQGRLDEAAAHLEAALVDHPRHPATLALLGRVRAAQGRDAEALDLYYRAARLVPDLATLAALGDLHRKAGQDFLAKTQYDAVEKADGDGPVSRDLVLYYCDHDRRLPRALELARRDVQDRKDVYTHDALAWALLKNGLPREAEAAAAEALKLGTRDAMLFFHAGVIHSHLGNRDKARDYLRQALATNPYFSPSGADEARRLLARLEAPPVR